MPDKKNHQTFYDVFSRDEWSRLAEVTPSLLSRADVAQLAALGDPISATEADEIYQPLAALLHVHFRHYDELARARSQFVHRPQDHPLTPFIIGVAGSVAVGKSTTSRLLKELLRRWPGSPRVELVTTDGFLYPNAELEHRGIAHRKGFPESYDRRGLLRFLSLLKSGHPEVEAPVYSHVTYDVTDEKLLLRHPDIVIVEGINVLQPAQPKPDGSPSLAVSDFFDFSIYVDAAASDIEAWYVERFLKLKNTAFANPDSYFRRYAGIDDEIAIDIARNIWASINLPNLKENIEPTRGRANLLIRKSSDHHIHAIMLRKI